ncbi:MAG TPA: hypothetical protein VF065_19230, partial [Ilumatobacter sp.]
MDKDRPPPSPQRGMTAHDTEGPSTDASTTARGAGTRLSRLRAWLSSVAATPRRRAVAGGSVVVIGVLATLYVAGAFSITSEQRRAPDASATPSEPDHAEQLPIDVADDAAFLMTATMSDAIGVDPGTEFVLTSMQDLPVD